MLSFQTPFKSTQKKNIFHKTDGIGNESGKMSSCINLNRSTNFHQAAKHPSASLLDLQRPLWMGTFMFTCLWLWCHAWSLYSVHICSYSKWVFVFRWFWKAPSPVCSWKGSPLRHGTMCPSFLCMRMVLARLSEEPLLHVRTAEQILLFEPFRRIRMSKFSRHWYLQLCGGAFIMLLGAL